MRSALASDDAVLVAVPEPNLSLLEAELADVADRVRFADMAQAGRNPGRILPGVLLPFAAKHAGRRVSIIGEPIWAGRSDVEYPACAVHEALINAVFAGRDAAILCPYDTSGLKEWVLDDAAQTHPVLADISGRRQSPAYADPVSVAERFNRPLSPPPPDAIVATYATHADLGAVRALVGEHTATAGLSPERAEDVTVAVNELATNTVQHSGGAGRLTLWVQHGLAICQVSDGGHLTDPLFGRIPSRLDAERGRGLVLVNLLCDLVRVCTGPSGTTIRLHMAISA